MLELAAWLYGVGGTVVGLVIGNWLAIGRDDRRRFREATDPAKKQIIRALEANVHLPAIDEAPLNGAVHVLSHKRRAKLRRLQREYRTLLDGGREILPSGEFSQLDKRTNEAVQVKLEEILGVLSWPRWKIW